MRKRNIRKTRSEFPLDIGKLYFNGFSAALLKSLEVPAPGPVDFELQFCQSILRDDPAHVEAMTLLGESFTRKGEYVKGLELDLRLSQLKPHNKYIRYNLACSYALTGQTEKAFSSLNKAVELGYCDLDHLRQDRDLDAIKSDPRFQQIIKTISARTEISSPQA